jgi:uncharacterized YigZ family protein
MQTVEERYICTTEVNRSKFIAHLVPIEVYKGLQKELKEAHPKANHVVYGLRYLNDLEQIVENSSDDAEPKGCAGLPTLNVLRGEDLINIAVLIVRYFGGIKLGTGGMARAYALSVKNVLNEANLIAYEKQISYTFESTYTQIDKTLYTLKSLGIKEYSRDFDISMVHWDIRASEENIKQFIEYFREYKLYNKK